MLLAALLLTCVSFAPAETPAEKRTRIHKEKQEYFLSGRTSKVGDSAEGLAAAQQEKEEKRAAREQSATREGSQAGIDPAANAFSGLTWQSLGPRAITSDATGVQSYGLVTGRVTAIAVDSKDTTGNTVFIGSANGGVWKSTNAAASDPTAVMWQALTDDKESLSIGSIAIQPGGNVILAGTGEPNSSASSYYGLGILRSPDNGQTWTLISNADGGATSLRGLGFGRIAFSTQNTSLVVAAAGGTPGSLRGAETSGSAARSLYVSMDSGQTWTKAIITDLSTNDVVPFSATAVVFNPASNRFYAALRYHGFYQSADGVNWTRMVSQPQPLNQPSMALTPANCPASVDGAASTLCPMYRADLTVREDTGELYAVWVDSNSASGGIYRLNLNNVSLPDDDTWTQLGQARIDDCGDIDGCGLQQATFNLRLKAVPNLDKTDLYLGTVNIFKCTIANGATCANASDWKNLTHAYGCESAGGFGAPAHVHPNQHAIDFGGDLGQRVYFGNDGGVYRTLTALALTNDGCTAPNPFQNLNVNLGSLAQVIDFANHPTDVSTLLTGVQSNGAPAYNGVSWTALNTGDGGYVAIDPASPNNFYSSFDGAGVYRCTNGLSCDRSSWTSVAGAEDLGTDSAAFFMPYQLDPQKSSALVIGTCRVWRGVPGNGYAALSHNLSTGDDTACLGGTLSGDTKIRSLASGGALTANGSQVLYAGMGGFTMPSAGKIFVTTNADGGPSTWSDRTGVVNPFGYDVADVAISPHDATGQTAYVAIMGFGASHIFKTTNAGVAWTNRSGDLPDVPVSAIVVDPNTPTQLYAGTDIGVFVSLDDGGTWNELGSGLPNTAVTKLKIFRSGSVKKLRAGTFGRGIWEIPLPGNGVSIGPDITDFVAVVGRSSERTVTITNNTVNTLSLNAFSTTGNFAIGSNTCPGSLASGASCTLGVIFFANAGGVNSGSVTVEWGAADERSTAQLQGAGIDFGVRVTRSSRPVRGGGSVAVVSAGQSASFEVETAVSGPVSLPLEFRCEAPDRRIRCSVSRSAAVVTSASAQPVTVSVQLSGLARKSVRLRNSVRSGEYYVTFVAKSGEETRSVRMGFRVK